MEKADSGYEAKEFFLEHKPINWEDCVGMLIGQWNDLWLFDAD